MDFGIYIHYPLCRRRCGYCDFATLRHPRFPHEAYADRVLLEAEHRAAAYAPWPLRSIYIGGGSPSLWPPPQVGRVLAALRAHFESAPEGVEITLECNPQDVDGAHLRALHAVGVNRLSIGAQSFDDDMLRRLTREHDSARTRRCVADARQAGFSNLNLDLIFGLRGQRPEHHQQQVRHALELGPEHLSIYALTLAARAALVAQGEGVVDDDLGAEMLEDTIAALDGAGYEHYEVSNFARPGHASAHNAAVWRGRPYLGLGASAHSMLWAGESNLRCANPPFEPYMRAPRRARGAWAYLEGAELEQVSPDTARYELLMLGLRTRRGVSPTDYQARFGDPIEQRFGRALEALRAAGLLERRLEAWVPTPRGMLFADAVALRLADA